MSFRVPALAAVVLVLASSSLASAQPQAPFRPRSSAFGNIFTPGLGQQQLQQQQFMNQFGMGGPGGGVGPAFVNPNFAPFLGLPGFANNVGQLAYQPALPGAFSTAAFGPQSGVVGTFNNLGHWYGPRAGYYGHWYPNGIASGRGILGYGGGSFGGGGFGGAGALGGGPSRFGSSTIGNVGGTALGVGAMMNQFRR